MLHRIGKINIFNFKIAHQAITIAYRRPMQVRNYNEGQIILSDNVLYTSSAEIKR